MIDEGAVGARLFLTHAVAIAAAFLLVAVWIGLGSLVRRRLLRDRSLDADAPADAPVRWVIDAALGGGALATALLAAGALGVLRPWVVLGMTGLAVVVVSPSLRAEGRALLTIVRSLRRSVAWPALATGLSALVLLLVAGAVAPPTEWDSLMYHLRIPLAFLDEGRVFLPRDSFHVALVGAAHFATLPLLAAGIVVGPAVAHVLVFTLVLLGAMALARIAGLTRTGAGLSAAILIGCPAIALTAITARVDVVMMLALLGAHLAFLRAVDDRNARLAVAGAVLVGVALATKPLAGAFALALIPLGWRAAGGWRIAAAAAGVALVVAAPWYAKNLLLVGAPLYPLGAAPRFEPWLADIFGSVAYPDSLDTSILRALPESRASFNLADAFLSPARLTIESEGRHYRLSPLLALLPLGVFWWRTHRRVTGIAVVSAGYAALVIVPFGQINLRYLMPALPGLAVGAAAVVMAVAAVAGRTTFRRAFLVALLIAAAWPMIPAAVTRFGGQRVLLRHALGLIPAREVWLWHPDAAARTYAPVIESVRRLTPPDAKLLLLWESRALPLGREALADAMISNWSFLAQSPAIENCLAGTGITHVLVNRGALAYYIERGASTEAFRLQALQQFGERCVVRRDEPGSDFELLVLAPRAR